MSKLFVPPQQGTRVALGLLALRLVAGAALVLHGWPKIQSPTGWIEGLKGAGMTVPDILVTLAPGAAVAEFIGGILIAVGLMSPIAALLVMGEMAAAIWVHMQNGHPFVDAATIWPAWELAALNLASALMILLAGPGAFSLDKALFKRS